MIWLILGLALWVATHMFKRLAPELRARLGDKGRPVAAILLLLSVVLMVIGYRSADGAVYWARSPMLVGINNLLMVIAFYVYAVGGPKGKRVWLGTKLRHPQLIGFSIWAVAHLLVNGDVPSFILFGGLLIWAQAEILLINANERYWTPPERAPAAKEITYIVATLIIVMIVMMIHNFIGPRPWG